MIGVKCKTRPRPHTDSSPHWRAGVIVSPVASTQSAPRPEERRRTSRHSVSAIIYVHLGSDNGGIVINLGTGGVAFQAAMRLTAKKDSTLSVRLRGSGLDVELIGEIVWLGASQKEAGICFKHPSTKQQQDIASWIVRQQQPHAAISYGERPWQELPPAISFPPAAPENFGSHSLAAALGMSQASPADAPSRINPDADPDDSLVSALLDPDGVSGVTPRLEVFPHSQEDMRPALDSAAQLREQNASSSLAAPKLLSPAPSISEIPPTERLEQIPIGDVVRPVRITDATPPVVKELPLSAAEARSEAKSAKSEVSKSDGTKPTLQERIPGPLERLEKASVAERWIPPVLLAIWRRGALPHRFLLASAAVAGVGFFAILLILAATRARGSAAQNPANLPPHPSAVPPLVMAPAASTASANQSSAAQTQQLAPPVYAPKSPAQPPSLLASLAKTFFGSDEPDPESAPIDNPIDDNHARVQVWTSKTNGYYYCTDDPFYKSVEPGTFMSQGDALQSGYRSILGQLCN